VRKEKSTILLFLLIAHCSLLIVNCSFDYGDQGGEGNDLPDIVMNNVEYVRVRSANPQARLQAERVERYENRRIMELRNFSFEQFDNLGETINAQGRAGSASFEIDTGDIRLGNGVRIEVESEDVAIETDWLEWLDRERTLTGKEEDEVFIFQDSGTVFSGIGFSANARSRTWEFTGMVQGTYIHEDNDDVTASDEDEGATE
jgi:LPS export ABC transporter protein LptC